MLNNLIDKLFNSENSFFKLADSAKRLPHIALSSFILLLFFIGVGSILAQLVFAPLLIGDVEQLSEFWEELFGLGFIFPVVLLTLFLWVKFVERRPFYTLGFTKHNIFSRYMFGFGTGVLMISIIVLLMALTGYVTVNNKTIFPISINTIGGVFLYLIAFILQGGTEEIMTRGWQLQVIGARYKPWLGVLISSIIFALLHGFNKGVNVLCIVNLFFFAVLLVLYVMNDGSIWSACGWHSAWNWTIGNVFGLSVSGASGGTVSILNLQAAGPDFITGGTFGPEGSIFTSAVLLAGIIIVAKKIMKEANGKIKIYSEG